MSKPSRAGYFEIWSRSMDGSPQRHGRAFGRTFDDACKQLASECIDFWTHYDKGRYQGRPLFESQALARAAVDAEGVALEHDERAPCDAPK